MVVLFPYMFRGPEGEGIGRSCAVDGWESFSHISYGIDTGYLTPSSYPGDSEARHYGAMNDYSIIGVLGGLR